MPSSPYSRTKTFPNFQTALGSDVKFEFDAIVTALAIMLTSGEAASGMHTFAAIGGTADALTFSHPYATWTTYSGKDNYGIWFQAASTNTGAVTLAVDGLAAKAVKDNEGNALEAGDLVAGAYYMAIYDETNDYFRIPLAINSLLTDVTAQVALANALSNYVGDWGDQTGTATVPTSVSYNGGFYALDTDLADITAKTPGTDPEWILVTETIAWSSFAGAQTSGLTVTHLNKLWKLNQNVADVTAKTPGTDPEWSELTNSVLEYQEFTSSGTWTKPAGFYTKAFVEVIAGGGSGAKDVGSPANCDGGGGGEYVGAWFDIDDLGATETVTIGAGGSGLGTGDAAGNGNPGGNTTFGSHLTARGGRGGAENGESDTRTYCAGGDETRDSGGYGCGAGATSGAGYNCTMGGAGGGAANTASSNGNGGTSRFGGDGGAAHSTTGVAGSQPGGGGGAVANSSSSISSGAGGDGICRVWCF